MRIARVKTTEVISLDGWQAVKLSEEFRFADATVWVRKEGEAVILEPFKSNTWPDGFFDKIHIDDPAFVRPPQGDVPLVPTIAPQ